MDPDGMHVLLIYKGEIPYAYFFKDGLDEEKVVSCYFIFIDNVWFIKFLQHSDVNVSSSFNQIYNMDRSTSFVFVLFVNS